MVYTGKPSVGLLLHVVILVGRSPGAIALSVLDVNLKISERKGLNKLNKMTLHYLTIMCVCASQYSAI
jgi:hypothetical protein